MSDLKPDFIPAMNYGQYINIILYKDIYTEYKITGSRHSPTENFLSFDTISSSSKIFKRFKL